jgi:predicted Zn-dependent protease
LALEKRVKILQYATISFLLLMISCSQGQQPSSEEACGFVQNAYGQRVTLKDAPLLKLYFDQNFPTQYYADVETAIEAWETVIGRKVFDLQPDPLPASSPAQDGVSVIYWMTTWDSLNQTQQANTTIYWEGNTITEADIKIDASYYSISDTPSPNTVDMQSLVLHELGHALGLVHDNTDQSVMNAYLNSDYERRTLYSADLSHIQCGY